TSHSYLTKAGKIIINANTYKSQHRNKTEAVSRFITYFNNVLATKKKRIDTKPTKSSIEKRLNEKRKNSIKKSLRKKPKYE
ncbi:MAG: aminoacyl-tRNA hydrolase, partial [Candidatus Neomarinimicrobiota bacterium]|nr:aminoacyl-tRNA hydrolase [Candidatus Neomarinimicrobiota bacterium]